AGVSVNLPVLDAGFSSGRVLEAKAGLKQSETGYADSVEQAQLEIRKAILSLNTSEQIVNAQKENVKQAEETMRLAKVRYENGMFTQVDLFDAETAWSNARLMYIQSVFLHHQARLSYLLATGRLGRELIADSSSERKSR
ncbi:MAG TPA: TolC family protein, partial [Candidatus Rifleibacterium sp.]|nr:TolC family protein [Candidatus Rifleibacterium sp.]